MSYYNTTNLNGADLKKSTGRAESQTEKILRFFLANPDWSFTPAMIHKVFNDILLTSVRRSMSDLTKSGDLIKPIHKHLDALDQLIINGCLTKLNILNN